MKKEKKEDSFIKQPYYKGGEKALKLFISENLKYPASSQSNKIEGDVHIRYDIKVLKEMFPIPKSLPVLMMLAMRRLFG